MKFQFHYCFINLETVREYDTEQLAGTGVMEKLL